MTKEFQFLVGIPIFSISLCLINRSIKTALKVASHFVNGKYGRATQYTRFRRCRISYEDTKKGSSIFQIMTLVTCICVSPLRLF